MLKSPAKAYYNEFDPQAAAWLRALIDMGLIAPGDVDERSIKEVSPDDLKGYTQAHFFAGIGGWSYAARLAGWPDEKPLWTGSCPCQPFSSAGKGGGFDDPRHLWPDFFRLIRACRPPAVMGEQVAGKAGFDWLDGVVSDLASEEYECRAVDIPACAVDAPNIRSRLYWVATTGDLQVSRKQGEGWGLILRSREGVGPDILRPSGQFTGPACGDGSSPGVGQADAHKPRSTQDRRDLGEVRGISAAERRTEDDPIISGGGHDPAFFDLADTHGGGRDGRAFQSLGGPEQRTAVEGPHAGVDMVDSQSLGRREGRAQSDLRGRGSTIAGTDAPGGIGTGVVDNARGDGQQSEIIPVCPGRDSPDIPDERAFEARSGVTLGDALSQGLEGHIRPDRGSSGWEEQDRPASPADGSIGGVDMADATSSGWFEREPTTAGLGHGGIAPSEDGPTASGGVGLADATGQGWDATAYEGVCREAQGEWARDVEPERLPRLLRNGTFWSGADWIICHDNKARRTESRIPLLVDGVPNRVAKWRGFGNAINPQLAAEVIAAFLESEADGHVDHEHLDLLAHLELDALIG